MECNHSVCQMRLYCTRCVAELEAELERLESNAMLEVRSNLVTRNLELEAENAKLKEAAQAVVEEKMRLSTYLGGPVAIDELNKRIRALAALVEVEQDVL